MDEILQQADAVAQSGQARWVSVVGPPGSGKTGLLRALASLLESRRGGSGDPAERRAFRVFSAQPPMVPEPEDSIAAQWLLAALGLTGRASPPERAAGLRKALEPLPPQEAERELAFLAPLLDAELESYESAPARGYDAASARVRAWTACSRFLSLAASKGPVALFLDDAQFLDAEGYGLLSYLFSPRRGAETVWGSPVLVVAASPYAAPYATKDDQLYREIATAKPDAAVRIALPKKDEPSAAAALPLLGPDARSVLTAAAVVGNRFAASRIVSLLPDLPVHDLLRSLAALGLLEAIEEAELYRFRSLSVAAAALAGADPAAVQSLHRRLAELIEERYHGQEKIVASALAHHYREAGVPLAASAYGILAAEVDENLARYEDAVDGFRKAAAEAPDAPGRVRAVLSAGRVLRRLSRINDAEREYRDGLSLAEEQGLEPFAADAEASLAYCAFFRHELPEAERLAEHARVRAKQCGNRLAEASAMNTLGLACYRTGRFTDAIAWYLQAQEAHRERQDGRGMATSLSNLGNVYHSEGLFEAATTAFLEALTMRRETGDRYGEAVALENLAVLHRRRGNYDQAMTAFRESLQVARDIGDVRDTADALEELSELHFERGYYADALDLAAESATLFHDLGDAVGEAVCLLLLARVHARRGAIEEAFRGGESALATLRGSEDHLSRPPALYAWGEVLEAVRDPAAAAGAYQETVDVCRTAPDYSARFSAEVALARLSRDRAAVKALYEKAVEAGLRPAALTALAAEARVALDAGDAAGAEGAAARAADQARALGVQPVLGETLWVLGNALLSLGRVGEALSTLTEAHLQAEALECPPLHQRTHESLANLHQTAGDAEEGKRHRKQAEQQAAAIRNSIQDPALQARFTT